jgi:uncharacterized protein (DUF952 family)
MYCRNTQASISDKIISVTVFPILPPSPHKMPHNDPVYVYKIADQPLPTPLPQELPLSSLDTQDGFIHLSNAARIPITAGLFFKAHTVIHVYKVDSKQATSGAATLKWVEEEDLKGCVHLHDGRLGENVVVGERAYERKEGESWSQAIERTEKEQGTWLVDEW